MNIGIVDSNETYYLYNVTFFNDQIHTLVTHDPSQVNGWISDIENIHHRRLHRLMVGLDVEWRPNSIPKIKIENPAATLQLCVGHRCLIFQLLHASHFPQSLKDFLGNPNYTFLGVKIHSDVEKLMKDHGLVVAKAVDLGRLAEEHRRPELRNAGLKILAKEVLGKEVEKRTPVVRSEWDNEWLTPAQVKYACVDAFLSFEIGRHLKYGNISKKKYGFCRIIMWLVVSWFLMEVLRRVFE